MDKPYSRKAKVKSWEEIQATLTEVSANGCRMNSTGTVFYPDMFDYPGEVITLNGRTGPEYFAEPNSCLETGFYWHEDWFEFIEEPLAEVVQSTQKDLQDAKKLSWKKPLEEVKNLSALLVEARKIIKLYRLAIGSNAPTNLTIDAEAFLRKTSKHNQEPTNEKI